jgi:hypothetical protein
MQLQKMQPAARSIRITKMDELPLAPGKAMGQPAL